MGRPRKYGSDAERQRARRSRLIQDPPKGLEPVFRGEQEPPDEPPPPDEPAPEPDTPDEEAYVREQLRQTELTVRMIRPLVQGVGDPQGIVDKRSPEAVTDRLQRAERYARWRYRGVQEGEVASL